MFLGRVRRGFDKNPPAGEKSHPRPHPLGFGCVLGHPRISPDKQTQLLQYFNYMHVHVHFHTSKQTNI
jgi:hypothetical protein